MKSTLEKNLIKKIYKKISLNSVFFTTSEILNSYRKPSTDLHGKSVGWFL